jgi:hypothetical protein
MLGGVNAEHHSRRGQCQEFAVPALLLGLQAGGQKGVPRSSDKRMILLMRNFRIH